MASDSHKKSKDEAINISKLHEHIKKNTPSGIKIKEAFATQFPLQKMFTSTVISGANRSTHHDLQIEIDGVLKVSQNQWSKTTAKHLNWIDEGNKKDRLKPEEFEKLLREHKPLPDFLKTVSMVSAMFGMMTQTEDKSKVNAQKKRFFDNVQGLNFPEDWDNLPEEEKTKRLEKIENFNLTR